MAGYDRRASGGGRETLPTIPYRTEYRQNNLRHRNKDFWWPPRLIFLSTEIFLRGHILGWPVAYSNDRCRSFVYKAVEKAIVAK